MHLIGRGEAGVVVLLAALLCPRIGSVHATDLGESYASNGNRLPLCPGLLRFGDLPLGERPRPASRERLKTGQW